ncbi:hypothetical protein PspLS_08083 [Pyricularia sp. CBS 133598]|nr:hypothetical protein PspLS_08083 [Pyricularia sp. CBS 133598]
MIASRPSRSFNGRPASSSTNVQGVMSSKGEGSAINPPAGRTVCLAWGTWQIAEASGLGIAVVMEGA